MRFNMLPRAGSAAPWAAPRPECGIRPVCPADAPAATGPAAGPVCPWPHLTGARAHKPRAAEVTAPADLNDFYIAPTVLVDVAWDSPIMQEEVFGPILPVLEIDSVQGVIDWVNGNPHPLGLYIFAEDHDITDQILSMTGSGDAVVNDCSLHPLVPELPFGGVGNSGMGKYHGHWGFEAFTNARTLVESKQAQPDGGRLRHD